uniref:Uncharacterized protein n=1 Tax=Ditylenchus dipsaci TaxID=166011 RepID=A0A915CZ71_9BILA
MFTDHEKRVQQQEDALFERLSRMRNVGVTEKQKTTGWDESSRSNDAFSNYHHFVILRFIFEITDANINKENVEGNLEGLIYTIAHEYGFVKLGPISAHQLISALEQLLKEHYNVNGISMNYELSLKYMEREFVKQAHEHDGLNKQEHDKYLIDLEKGNLMEKAAFLNALENLLTKKYQIDVLPMVFEQWVKDLESKFVEQAHKNDGLKKEQHDQYLIDIKKADVAQKAASWTDTHNELTRK